MKIFGTFNSANAFPECTTSQKHEVSHITSAAANKSKCQLNSASECCDATATRFFKTANENAVQLHVEVEQAMAVLDKDTGKLLNYRQLLVHPKYRKDWSISSANEFGRLAQGV
jgi:hypothetical protein